MQLVLSGNRIIAHGENFLPMGGVVINTETGKKYDNCTIAECNNCPSDINQVGYEYHGGVFVPCAPFGKGDGKGTFMELCNDCKTPSDSGIKVSSLKWDTIATMYVQLQSYSSDSSNFIFDVDHDELAKYTEIAIIAKSGVELYGGSYQTTAIISIGSNTANTNDIVSSTGYGFRKDYSEDTVLYTCGIHARSELVETSTFYELATRVYLNGKNVVPSIVVQVFNGGGVKGTFELKARGNVDSIIGG